MGLFDIFRTKKTKNNSKNFRNPSDFFAYVGPTMNKLWQNIVEGENQAVDIFNKYTQFFDFLSNKYSNIDFQRQVEFLTIGEMMYLYCLDFKEDIYISKTDNLTDVILLSRYKYNELSLKMSDYERAYIVELKNFIDNNIKQLCSSVSIRMFGVDFIKTTLPTNTLKCVKYHQYLVDVAVNGTYNHKEKWNRIYATPIIRHLGGTPEQDNPLILISIEHIDALILDYICYATITLPTEDMVRVLEFKDQNTNKTVLMTIDEKLGEGASVFADRAITEMNGAPFRQWVRSGIKVK